MYNNEHLFNYLVEPLPPLILDDFVVTHNTHYSQEQMRTPPNEEQLERHKDLMKEVVLLAKLHAHRQPQYQQAIESDWTEKKVLAKALEAMDWEFKFVFRWAKHVRPYDYECSFDKKIEALEHFIQKFKEFTVLFSSDPNKDIKQSYV